MTTYVRKGGVLGFSGVLTTSTYTVFNDPIDAENISLVNYLTGPYFDPDYAVRFSQTNESTPGLAIDFLYGIDQGDTYYWYRASITVYSTGRSWVGQTLDLSFNFNQTQTGSNSNPATLPFSYSIRHNGTLITPSYINWSKDLGTYADIGGPHVVQGGQYSGEPTYVVLPTWTLNTGLSFPDAYLSLKQAELYTTSTFTTTATGRIVKLADANLQTISSANFTSSVLHDFGEADYVTSGYVNTGYITTGSIQVPNQLSDSFNIAGYEGFVLVASADLQSSAELPPDSYVDNGYLSQYESWSDGDYVDAGYADSGYFQSGYYKAYYFPTVEFDVILGTNINLAVETALNTTATYTAGAIVSLENPTQVDLLANVDYSAASELSDDFYLDQTPSVNIQASCTIENTIGVSATGQVSVQVSDTISQQIVVDATAANKIDFGITYSGLNYADVDYYQELIEERYVKTDYVAIDYFTPDYSLPIELIAETNFSATVSVGAIITANLSAAADISITGGYLLATGTVLQSATADFTIQPYLTGGTGVIIASTLAQVDATFSTTQEAKNTTNTTADLAAEFTTTIEQTRLIFSQTTNLITESVLAITPHHILGTTAHPVVDTNLPDVLCGYGIFAQAQIQGEGFAIATGRLVIVDEYYVVKVRPETNIIPVLVEPRTSLVRPETRVITVGIENRDILVEPETRVYKITANKAVQDNKRTRRIEQ